jgi:hypothetical protein
MNFLTLFNSVEERFGGVGWVERDSEMLVVSEEHHGVRFAVRSIKFLEYFSD